MKDKVMEFCSRVNIAASRRITEEQVAIIHKDIMRLDIPEVEFDRIAEMYLDEEKIPDNIYKYFKDHKREYAEKKPETIPQKDAEDGSFNAKQINLIVGMTGLALRCYHSRTEDYKKWAVWFNAKCMSLDGENLTAFLTKERERLTPKQTNKPDGGSNEPASRESDSGKTDGTSGSGQ